VARREDVDERDGLSSAHLRISVVMRQNGGRARVSWFPWAGLK
jgi:hypothetical protein